MKTTLFVTLSLFATGALADDCEHDRQIDRTLDIDGADRLVVVAGAGDLEIQGRPGLDGVRVRARVCASSEVLADEAGVDVHGGRDPRVATVMPDVDWGFSLSGRRYVYIDLELEVPEHLALDVKDSSGSMDIENVGSLTVSDSSGSIDITDVLGDVVLNDSSGDIEIVDVQGNVLVESDSSGDIDGRDITGTARVVRDSSGGIRFEDVGGDVIVERDSSGSIVARRVGGDFRVMRDGSGGIRHEDVSGQVVTPDRS